MQRFLSNVPVQPRPLQVELAPSAVEENVEVELADVAGPAAAVRKENADVAGPAAAIRKDNADVAGPAAAVRKDNADEAGPAAAVRKDNADEAGPAAAVREDNADVAGPAAAVRQDNADVVGPAAAVHEDNGDAEEQLGENIFHDAGTWPRYVPDELRVELVRRGPLGFHNKDGPFPANPETNRSMNRRWFDKMLGWEQLLRSWLIYSPCVDCVQCFCSLLYGTGTSTNIWKIIWIQELDKVQSSYRRP